MGPRLPTVNELLLFQTGAPELVVQYGLSWCLLGTCCEGDGKVSRSRTITTDDQSRHGSQIISLFTQYNLIYLHGIHGGLICNGTSKLRKGVCLDTSDVRALAKVPRGRCEEQHQGTCAKARKTHLQCRHGCPSWRNCSDEVTGSCMKGCTEAAAAFFTHASSLSILQCHKLPTSCEPGLPTVKPHASGPQQVLLMI